MVKSRRIRAPNLNDDSSLYLKDIKSRVVESEVMEGIRVLRMIVEIKFFFKLRRINSFNIETLKNKNFILESDILVFLELESEFLES